MSTPESIPTHVPQATLCQSRPNPMPESILSPCQGLRIWPLVPGNGGKVVYFHSKHACAVHFVHQLIGPALFHYLKQILSSNNKDDDQNKNENILKFTANLGRQEGGEDSLICQPQLQIIWMDYIDDSKTLSMSFVWCVQRKLGKCTFVPPNALSLAMDLNFDTFFLTISSHFPGRKVIEIVTKGKLLIIFFLYQ